MSLLYDELLIDDEEGKPLLDNEDVFDIEETVDLVELLENVFTIN